MTDEHKQQAAACLAESHEHSPTMYDREERVVLTLEALVHAVLHLAEVVEVRETIRREQ